MSDYASINSTKHKAWLAKIGFTDINCVDWVTNILRKRTFATIQSFSLFGDEFRVSYEIDIPLDYVSSPACQRGEAGTNQHFNQYNFLTYTLVIK